MGDFPFVDWLARSYHKKGEKTGCWSDYLKAHGLANYCVALDPTDVRHQLVYDIEKSWYKGKHPLTYRQHRDLTERHEHFLDSYRNRIEGKFVELSKYEKSLTSKDVFCESNMKFLQDFADNIFKASELCSSEFVEVCREIISSCVGNLKLVGLAAPCNFTVLGLGSVAKREATPYSDLEYAFIVESEDEYFTSLAVESYFRIGNLCESALEGFDISELKDSSLPLTGLPTTGFRIDGIKPKAGNIPTGRVGGQKLILTVDGFMELYKTSAMTPFDGVAGDLSDMLSSSIQIYSSQGDSSVLYELLRQLVTEYERSVAKPAFVNRKRLHSFLHDIESYHYLPEQSITGKASGVGILVKPHIFRYPTLLANNLRLIMSFGCCPPWDTFEKLKSLGMLSQSNKVDVQIALALSIYIRTKAYITMKTQSKVVSLYTSSVHDESMYHIPQVLFVTLGCLLIPIKHCIRNKLRHCFHSLDNGADIQHIVGLLTRSIVVDETDFMLKVELFHFVEDRTSALKELDLGVGGSIESAGCEKFLEVLRHKYQTTKSDPREYKCLKLACSVLYNSGGFAAAIDFYSWLITYLSTQEDIARCKLQIAECMYILDDLKGAKSLCNQAIRSCKQALDLEQEQDLLQYLSDRMRKGNISDHTLYIYELVMQAYMTIGKACTDEQLYQFDESLQSFTSALSLCKLLLCCRTKSVDQLKELSVLDMLSIDWQVLVRNVRVCSTDDRFVLIRLSEITWFLSSLYLAMGNLRSSLDYVTRSLDISTALYGENTNHTSVEECMHLLGRVNSKLGKHSLSLNYHLRALDVLTALYGTNTDHLSIAITYDNIADTHRALGNLTTALTYSTKALAMYQSLYGVDTNHRCIAEFYGYTAEIYVDMGEHKTALDYSTKALDMMKVLYGAHCRHPRIADIYNIIGRVHHAMCECTSALLHLNSALSMRQVLHGDVNHPDIAEIYCNIASVHSSMEDYHIAMGYQVKSLAMTKAVYGDDYTHISIAKCYRDIGLSHKNLGNYLDSFESLLESLEMANSQPTSNTIQQVIASCYLHLGYLYNVVSRYVHASECCTQALVISVNITNSVLSSQTLLELSNLQPHQFSYKHKLQFLQIAQKKAGSDIVLQIEILHHVGNCYMQLHRWRKAWLCLCKALSNCQSLTFCKPSLLVQVHLSIGQLLLHLGYISQSLEHSQLALDITSTCRRLAKSPIPLYIALNRDSRLLTSSLQLVKICQLQFYEFKLSPEFV